MKKEGRPVPLQVEDFTFTIEPFGLSQKEVDDVVQRLLEQPIVQKWLVDTQNRLLVTELVERSRSDKPSRPVPPDGIRATVYDYTHGYALIVSAPLKDLAAATVEVTNDQPLPTREEFAEAIRILERDPELGVGLREGLLTAYPPMPPTLSIELPDGHYERIVAVGLLPIDNDHKQFRHEIVGVTMSNGVVIHYEGGAPSGSVTTASTCGISLDAHQSTEKNAAGQVWVTILQGGKKLWRFLAVRPAASSGATGNKHSGVELRYVDYLGKRVLYRAHVPILNVRYDKDACGPYRDWQSEEGLIQANGTDVAPGFRLCNTPATTILDTGSDTGNFLGVAIYVQGQEVVLVSEMQAAWYRYVSEWRFHVDGTLRPRFGFAAVQSGCVCNRHHHHVYWRFDFDIVTAGNNIVHEFNDPPIFSNQNWHTKQFEIRRPRDPAHKRKWRVENATTGDGYEIIPGPNDGTALTSPDWSMPPVNFPAGDVWVLRYHGNEIEDCVAGVTLSPQDAMAHLDNWLTGESVKGQDVVIWYAGHVTHDVIHDAPGEFGHVCGPDLRPVKW